MTKIEKMVIGIFMAILILWVGSIFWIGKAVDDAGGVKQVIIDMGREVTDIAHEIEKE